MRTWFFLLIIFIFGLLQSTILNSFRILAVKPDLIVACVVVASVFLNWRWALFSGLFAGIFKDIFGTAALGINILLLPLWSYLLAKLSKKVSLDDKFVLMATVFIVIFLNDIVSRFINLYFGKFIALGIFLRITFIEALYSALVLPLVLLSFDYLKNLARFKNVRYEIHESKDY